MKKDLKVRPVPKGLILTKEQLKQRKVAADFLNGPASKILPADFRRDLIGVLNKAEAKRLEQQKKEHKTR